MNLNQKYKYRTIPKHTLRAGASILYGHLLMCEIMMADLTQKYVLDLKNALQEEGLAKHKLKQLMNQLLACTQELKKRCDEHDAELVIGFTIDTWPMLVQEYYEGGGTVTQRLQCMFAKRNGNTLSMLYVACKNAVDRNKIAHNVVVANVLMVLQTVQTSIDLYDYIVSKIKAMMGDGVRMVKSMHNERMMSYSREMVRLLTSNYEVQKEDAQSIRKVVEIFYHELTSESLLTAIDNSISDMRNDYCRFVIATLASKVRNRSLTMREIRMLTARLCTFDNTRKFIRELQSLEYSFDEDPMDVTNELGINETDTPILHQFLTLCHDGKIMEAEKEDERKVRCRELRQEARSNDGLLPDGSLVQLYKELGTKRAVDELLAQAGNELLASRKRFAKMKVTEYKTKEKNKNEESLSRRQIRRHSEAFIHAGRINHGSLAGTGLYDAPPNFAGKVQSLARK